MPKYPITNVRTSHVLSIRVNGVTIGMIRSWGPAQSRTFDPLYEVNAVGCGDIAEQVPSVMSGQTVSITRVDLYRSLMEQAWGSGFNIDMLCDQTKPLTVREFWKDPENPKGLPETGNSIKNIGNGLKQSVKDWGKELSDPSKWFSPSSDFARVYVYDGFWFSNIGRTINADGDRIVQAHATAVYTRYYRAL